MNTLNHRSNDPRENNFVLEKKIVSIHSEDRDIKKWPRSNNFEVQLPDAYKNVHSIRLADISLPVNYYTFSNYNQNTKMMFTMTDEQKQFTITIREGFYQTNDLTNVLTNMMNSQVSIHRGSVYTGFTIHFDHVSFKMFIGNTMDSFTLNFGEQMIYDNGNMGQPTVVWNYNSNWGLPSNIGFEKKDYASKITDEVFYFHYLNAGNNQESPFTWLKKDEHYVEAPHMVSLLGDQSIYMEVDKYNSIDELQPYSEATSDLFTKKGPYKTGHNDYGTNVKSAFAKIAVPVIPLGQIVDTKYGTLGNIMIFTPPIDKLCKLKFLFRYHDGRLVDFNTSHINMTLELNLLRNELEQTSNVRVPTHFTN